MLPNQMSAKPPMPAPAGTRVSDVIRSNWPKLTPEQQQVLKDAVTVDNIEAFCNLLGHDIKPLLAPLVEDELGGDDLDYEDAGPEAVPYASTPISQVRAMGYGGK